LSKEEAAYEAQLGEAHQGKEREKEKGVSKKQKNARVLAWKGVSMRPEKSWSRHEGGARQKWAGGRCRDRRMDHEACSTKRKKSRGKGEASLTQKVSNAKNVSKRKNFAKGKKGERTLNHKKNRDVALLSVRATEVVRNKINSHKSEGVSRERQEFPKIPKTRRGRGKRKRGHSQ